MPNTPRAWLLRVAKNAAIDRVRREATLRDKSPDLEDFQRALAFDNDDRSDRNRQWNDDRLALMFLCCHPALAQQSQVALTLRLVCGLTAEEIARAFLAEVTTIQQRIVRAKKQIKLANIAFALPDPQEIQDRLEPLQDAIYLLFNEGYTATSGDSLMRTQLASEAIWLARVLVEISPPDGETHGLLALMLLHGSRRRARVGPDGRLVRLREQDRSRWIQSEIIEGLALTEQALRLGPPGRFALQAAIAAVHSEAQAYGDTDWPQIAALYRLLTYADPSPVVKLGYVVALSFAHSPDVGLTAMHDFALSETLADYHLYHVTRAELLAQVDRADEATAALDCALSLTNNAIERAHLAAQRDQLRAR